MKTRWLACAGVILAFMVAGLGATSATATAPVTFGSTHVVDEANALSDSELQSAETRLSELTQASGLDLFVVFVDEFTDPTDADGWANAVAEQNGMGTRDYVLAVAIDQRNYAFSADSGGPISASQQDQIEQAIEQKLSGDDWAGAITAAADQMQGDGGAGFLTVLLILVVIVVIAVVIWLIVRSVKKSRRAADVRRRGAMPDQPDPNDPFSTLTDEQVATQAGSALVQADDAITSSKEELGFAIAQFGEQTTAEFSQAVDAAKAKMSEAFDLKQKLDDEIEDTVQDRRAWHIRIIGIAEEIDDLLDANTEAFDALRKLEQNAPVELERVRRERAALDPLLADATPTLSRLTGIYDAAALSTVSDNPAQAQERAALADRSIDAAAQAITAERSGEAAFAIRTAEQAVAQAAQLVQAISALGAELAAIETQSRALFSELQGDISAARQLPDPQRSIAATIAATEAQLHRAQENLGGASRSPQQVLAALTAANAQIDAVIAQGREDVERVRRAQQMLEQTLTQANSEIRSGREFIETRRGTVGSTARTRLSQAEDSLTRALDLRASDPEASLTEANRALELARQATASAQADVQSYAPSQSQNGGWGNGPFGGSNSGGSGLGGDILGGIIGGLLSGGGGGSSSRGSSWRSTGGSGGFRSSGFGGGGRSSGGGRRSGGGRF
ncbi:MAG: TPM domain-containing protein [Candidatus Microbacterium colombiense]|nr:MAG: TPM domain-containing protein [Microbacterium sp.]